MKRIVPKLPVALAVSLGAVLIAASVASGSASSRPVPQWLKAAETRTLDTVFGHARPIRTTYIAYPHKIAVIWEFNHLVICGTCSGPDNASIPRGRVIRVSFSRQTHQLGDAFQLCETRGLSPARALCLRR